MLILDDLIKNKGKIQKFLDCLNCDSEKWFVYNCATGDNPTLRKFSHRMSHRIMDSNSEMFKSRFLYLKIKKDMRVTCEHYKTVEVNDMDLEIEKYDELENAYLRKDIMGEMSEFFLDDRIYTIHYIEALGGVDPHQDPWIYNKNYKNVIFYDNLPRDIKLIINGSETPIDYPQQTNFGNEEHSYRFNTRPTPLKILHIDYEDGY